MNRNNFTIIILIALIGVASIILGIMFATVTHSLSKEKGVVSTSISGTDSLSQQDEIARIDTPKVEALYETYVLISTEREQVLNCKEKLEYNGYELRINESQRANKLIFSLIVNKEFNKGDAILTGEEIKEKFPEITSYWVELVPGSKPETILAENGSEDQIETDPDEIGEKQQREYLSYNNVTEPDNGELYEVQILSSNEIERINAVKMLLELDDYKTKVINFDNNGVPYYRLRLADTYTMSEGKRMGEELKLKFKFITSYWLDKAVIK